jgi:SnoaL-like domain
VFGEDMAVNKGLDVVRHWHDAVNRGDADELVALSRENIEIGGPRGTATGSSILRDWVGRAGIHLETGRWFAGRGNVVVEQIATWRTLEGGLTEPAAIASSFRVEDGKVSSTVRFESLESALAESGLTMQDEVPHIAR